MKSALPLYAVAGGLASILARPAAATGLGCYNYDTDYFGYDVEKILEGPATESPQKCQEACQRNELCAHWTYIEERRQCYLKDANAPRSAVPNPIAISGPRVCFQAPSCFEEGVDYFGNDMEKIEDGSVQTPEACQQLCQRASGCTFWTHIRNKKNCYLKQGPAPLQKVMNGEAVSGPAVCGGGPPPDCFETDIDYVGFDLPGSGNNRTESPAQCQALCVASPECLYWTWLSSLKTCYIKNKHALKGRKQVPGCVSGPRNCECQPLPPRPPPPAPEPQAPEPPAPEPPAPEEPAPESPEPGSPEPGSPEPESPAPAPPAPETPPPEPPAPAPPAPAPPAPAPPSEPEAPVPPQYPQPAPPQKPVPPQKPPSPPGVKCYSFGIMYKGADLAGYRNVANHRDCQQRCQQNPKCMYFTYFTRDKFCALKSAKGRPFLHKYAISGARSCPGVSTSECVKEDVEIFGRVIATAVVNNAEQCEKLCELNVLCASYTYNKITKVCIQTQHEGPALGVISGHRTCQAQGDSALPAPPPVPADCFNEGFEFTGPGIGIQESVASPEECQQVCQRDFLCSAFTYSKTEKKCLLQGWAGSKAAKPTAVSGLKYCSSTPPPRQQCILGDYELYGKDLSALVVDSPQTCQKLCQTNPLCVVWAFKAQTKVCYQRTREAYALKMVSGHKHRLLSDY